MAAGAPRPRGWWLPSPILTWITFSVVLSSVVGQENAGMTIASSLVDCYANASLLNRDGLPPFGIAQLIDIIRKVEDYRRTSLDLRMMTVQLTHRFRQDGIRRDPRIVQSDGVVPFTPSGPEFFRHKILLTKLIPGNAYNFPNESLSLAEQCALHFMMSSTVDDVQRGDESQTCSNLKNYETDGMYGGSSSSGGYYRPGSSYQTGRQGGSFGGGYSSGVNYYGRKGPSPTSYPTRGPRRTRQAREANPGIEEDVEILDPELKAQVHPRASMSNYPRSTCPIQGGVVLTPWGSVAAGTVIAGIAAGLVPQSVPVEMLSAAFPRSKYYTQRNGRNPGLSADTLSAIDNKWAATFSGDLAQVALIQGATAGNNMLVGLPGGWDSAQEPSHYYVTPPANQLTVDGAMSDSNIRGCIDGMVLGTYANGWYSQSGQDLKLSQLLDMYYSERGVFDRSTRACQRTQRLGDVATTGTLDAQTEAFSKFYGRNNPFSVTMTDDVINRLSDTAVDKLQNYITSSLNDPPCTAASADLLVRPYVDLVLILDTSWEYRTMHPSIGFLLDKLDAGSYGSRVMILNGKDGSMLFNSTYPRLEWHTIYTENVHNSIPSQSKGFDALTALSAAIQQLRQHDYDFHYRRVLGGRAQAVLFVMNQGMGGYDQNTFYDRFSTFRQLYPDVDPLVLTQGNRNAFAAITNDTNRDVFVINPSEPATAVLQLVERVKAVPRRLRNPNCNADWIETRTGNSEFSDYVEPLGVNYYRLAPNNFYRTTDDYAKIRVTTQGYGSLTVCYSRSLPAMNGTKNTFASQSADSGTCQQLSNQGFELRLSNWCKDASLVKDCAPLYLAVSAPGTSAQGNTGSVTCREPGCRFPDMLKYTVIIERLGCWSGASGLQAAGLLATLLLALSLRQLL